MKKIFLMGLLVVIGASAESRKCISSLNGATDYLNKIEVAHKHGRYRGATKKVYQDMVVNYTLDIVQYCKNPKIKKVATQKLRDYKKEWRK